MENPHIKRNAERLNELADWLAVGAPERNGVATYDQGEFQAHISNYFDESPNVCGSVCCLAGTAVMWWGNKPPFYSSGWINNGMRALGIEDTSLAERLFAGGPPVPVCAYELINASSGISRIKPQYAARVVRHFANTGIVNWRNPPCE